MIMKEIKISLRVVEGDISDEFSDAILATNHTVSIDTETNGLDWKSCSIACCQVYCEELATVEIVRFPEVGFRSPNNLFLLLHHPNITKIFHYAMFDLRFIYGNLYNESGLPPQNIFCTKVASRIVNKEYDKNHSLKNILKDNIGVELKKECALSDWFAKELTDEQIEYAVDDVLYLSNLMSYFKMKANFYQRETLDDALNIIPTLMNLHLIGHEKIFEY